MAIPRPADIQRLAFHRAPRHLHEFRHHAHLGGIIQSRIAHDGAIHQGQGQVSHVDGKAQPFAQVKARLPSAQFCIIRYVVMDEGSGMEMLDGCRSRGSQISIASHRQASGEADQRPVALAAIVRIDAQRAIEIAIHIRMRTFGDEAVYQPSHAVRIAIQIFFECSRRALDRAQDLRDGFHIP